MNDTKIFITEQVPGEPLVLLVDSYFGESHALGNALFLNSAPTDFSYTGFSFVDTPASADYIMYPHPITRDGQKSGRPFQEAVALAHSLDKPLIAFAGRDIAFRTRIPGTVLLKGSQYRYQTRDNEIIMPHFVEDLGKNEPPVLRTKSPHPSVGFCGWVSSDDLLTRFKIGVKNVSFHLFSLIPGHGHLVVRKKGLWWRARAIKRLKETQGIEANFIERRSFSGSIKTISLDPVRARQEYIDNMRDNDFTLAPKGDANISLRFYEALSLGRIPILIDTAVVLPAEEVLNYDAFIVRVPYQEIDRIGEIVKQFYAELTDESFAQMQQAAKDAFTRYLRYDSYFNYLFGSEELARAAEAARAQLKQGR